MVKIDIVSSALKILIEQGSLSRDEFPKSYENIVGDGEVHSILETMCKNLGLYLSDNLGVFYVSPIPGIKTFGYTNEEMRREFGYAFNNDDLYTALFIITNIITEFFSEADKTHRKYLSRNELMEIIDRKIDALREKVNINEISNEKSYNFEIVVKKWIELPRVQFDKTDIEHQKEFGKTSKIQLINTTLRFLENEDLIKVVSYNDDKSIYLTDRFIATAVNVYNDDEMQREIYNFIYNISSMESEG